MSARAITRPWRTQPPSGYRFNRDSHLARLARFAHVFTPQSTVDLTGNGATLAPGLNLIGYVGGPFGLGWLTGAQTYQSAITVSGATAFNAGSEGFWAIAVLNEITNVDFAGGSIIGYSGDGNEGLGISGGNAIWYWYSGIRLTGPAVPLGAPVVIGGWYDANDAMLFVNGQFASASHGGVSPTGRTISTFGGQAGQNTLWGNIAAVFAGWGKPPNEFFLRAYENPWQVFEPRRGWVPVSAGGATYNLSISEAASAADAMSAVAALLAAVNEAAAALDAMGGGLSIAGTISEAATAADAVDGQRAISLSVTEPAAAADQVGAQAALVGGLIEGGAAADQVSSTAVLMAGLAETANAQDATGLEGNAYALSLAETAAATDQVSAQLVAAAALAETAAASDQVSAQATLVGGVDEAATALDALTTQLDGVAGVAEAAAASDFYAATGGTAGAAQTLPPRPAMKRVGGSMDQHP